MKRSGLPLYPTLFVLIAALAIPSFGQKVSILHSFNGKNSSASPRSVVPAQGHDGNLYGTQQIFYAP